MSSSDAYTNASGTMIIKPGDTLGASGSAMETMIVAENGDEQSSDYLAALRAASASDYRCLHTRMLTTSPQILSCDEACSRCSQIAGLYFGALWKR